MPQLKVRYPNSEEEESIHFEDPEGAEEAAKHLRSIFRHGGYPATEQPDPNDSMRPYAHVVYEDEQKDPSLIPWSESEAENSIIPQ